VDLEIEGLSESDLVKFYRGLSVNLAHKLARVRTEAIRVSECKSFNDRQTVLKVCIHVCMYVCMCMDVSCA
jgi:hypothetical protein